MTALLSAPFGGRKITPEQIAAQLGAILRHEHPSVEKYRVLDDLTIAHETFGLARRSLSVLRVLVSFLPGRELKSIGQAPLVHASNEALINRSHMGEVTLRRHIASLVDNGFIIRRDSANGKRFVREEGDGQYTAFGFDLTPLITRAPEIAEARAAQEWRIGQLHATRSSIRVRHRNIEMIASGMSADDLVQTSAIDIKTDATKLLQESRTINKLFQLAEIAARMAELEIRFTDKLNSLDVFAKMNGNAVHFERHHQNQNTESILDDKKALGDVEMDARDLPHQPAATRTLTIKAVIKACPDISSQAPGKRITSWPALAAAAEIFRPMLGISPDAWDMARDAMGIDLASACIAIILQRSALSSDAVSVSKGNAIETRVFGIPAITSPGGYLRTLTEEFKAGRLSVPNLVMTINTTRMRTQYVREVVTP